MFSKKDIEKAIQVINEEIEYIKLTCPNATVEIDNLEFAILSLEGYRDREVIEKMLREEENLIAKNQIF